MARRRRRAPLREQITISVSTYTDVLERIDLAVDQLKRRGYTKMNRSRLLRLAFQQFDPDRLPDPVVDG